MTGDFLPDRIRELSAEVRETRADVARLDRHKAGHDDVKVAVGKADAVETEMRQKFRKVDAELQDLADQLRRALATVEQVRDDLDGLGDAVRRTRKDVRGATKDDAAIAAAGGDWLSRAPKWAWALMGAGALAILASGGGAGGAFLAKWMGG